MDNDVKLAGKDIGDDDVVVKEGIGGNGGDGQTGGAVEHNDTSKTGDDAKMDGNGNGGENSRNTNGGEDDDHGGKEGDHGGKGGSGGHGGHGGHGEDEVTGVTKKGGGRKRMKKGVEMKSLAL